MAYFTVHKLDKSYIMHKLVFTFRSIYCTIKLNEIRYDLLILWLRGHLRMVQEHFGCPCETKPIKTHLF